MSDLQPPHSIEAEQSLIGALLLDNGAFDRITGKVDPADCYLAAHTIILRAIFALIEQGKAADIVTVSELLALQKQDKATGGIEYLAPLANNCPSAANISRYAEIVRDRATLRRLMAAANEIRDIAIDPTAGTAQDRVSKASEKIAKVVESGIKATREPQDIATCLNAVIAAMESASDGEDYRSYKTGLKDLDPILYDLVPGALDIIAGRPGMGKSSLALQIAGAVAGDGKPGAVAIFSLEMPATQVTFRLLSHKSRVPLAKLMEAKNLTELDYSAIAAATGDLYQQSIVIDDQSGIRPEDIRARCNLIKRKNGGLKLIVVDYLQLMKGSGDNRTQEIGSISRDLTAIAKDFMVPVVALSQLNRSLESRPNKRPVMSDLRESGDIEQDASLIIFCYRDEVYNPESSDKGTAELIVGKQRNGPTGFCRTGWVGDLATFVDLDHAAYSQQKAQSETRKPRVRSFD